MRKLLLFCCLFPAFVWAQEYVEVSGQTNVFTLAPGAKVGPSPVLPNRMLHAARAHLMSTAGGLLHIDFEGGRCHARLSIYNLTGRLVQAAQISSSTTISLRRGLPNGIYFARLEADGIMAQTVRFWKAR